MPLATTRNGRRASDGGHSRRNERDHRRNPAHRITLEVPGDVIEAQRLDAGPRDDPREPRAQQQRLQRGRLEIPQVFGLELHPAVAQHARGPGIQRRRGDEEDAAGLEQRAGLFEEAARVADVFDHVGEDANVVAVRGGRRGRAGRRSRRG